MDEGVREYRGVAEYDRSRFGGFYAKFMAEREAPFVASDLGLRYIRTLGISELVGMARALSQGGPIRGDLRGFCRADLVVEGERDGQTHMIAVEVSYTVTRGDASRAMRNAAFLREVTGLPATAVVAGVNWHYSMDPLLSGGEVRWYQLEDDTEELE